MEGMSSLPRQPGDFSCLCSTIFLPVLAARCQGNAVTWLLLLCNAQSLPSHSQKFYKPSPEGLVLFHNLQLEKSHYEIFLFKPPYKEKEKYYKFKHITESNAPSYFDEVF